MSWPAAVARWLVNLWALRIQRGINTLLQRMVESPTSWMVAKQLAVSMAAISVRVPKSLSTRHWTRWRKIAKICILCEVLKHFLSRHSHIESSQLEIWPQRPRYFAATIAAPCEGGLVHHGGWHISGGSMSVAGWVAHFMGCGISLGGGWLWSLVDDRQGVACLGGGVNQRSRSSQNHWSSNATSCLFQRLRNNQETTCRDLILNSQTLQSISWTNNLGRFVNVCVTRHRHFGTINVTTKGNVEQGCHKRWHCGAQN